ncbi:hypothetical protein L7750_10515 [Xenorhabdus bovienii]|uniref:hypothetical protein n=1 Tax=Xenorhabdus bovienii TaxID=40576 RepID=UPI001EE1433F|nr:hypothetical protein [Xenorhabdus bovienii]MCG3470807.1 hypothetical protein [Xenorhabdus bovienii]
MDIIDTANDTVELTVSHALQNLPQYDDKKVTEILDKYTPKFKPLNHMKFSAKSVLGYYVRIIRKERK